MTQHRYRLFVYGTLLAGERDFGLLEGATLLSTARTQPIYQLIDLGAYAALVAGGSMSALGELYDVDLETLTRVDVARQVPALFRRAPVQLIDVEGAHAYFISADQARGRRRLHHGDWRRRFAPNTFRPPPSPLVAWARQRFPKS
jgi:gamma-glutamylaminecyclotransferase